MNGSIRVAGIGRGVHFYGGKAMAKNRPDILTVCGDCDDGWVTYKVQAAVKDGKGRQAGYTETRRRKCNTCKGEGRLKLR